MNESKIIFQFYFLKNLQNTKYSEIDFFGNEDHIFVLWDGFLKIALIVFRIIWKFVINWKLDSIMEY